MIVYMPNMDSILWSKKCQVYFDNFEDMKAFIADQYTRFCRFIGKDKAFLPEDVELKKDIDTLFGWKNYHCVEIDGKTIGFCGE